jgi:NADH-quinone oxidoreductase subunit C
VTVVVGADRYLDVMRMLREPRGARFELLSDVCGVDYSTFGWRRPRRSALWPSSTTC